MATRCLDGCEANRVTFVQGMWRFPSSKRPYSRRKYRGMNPGASLPPVSARQTANRPSPMTHRIANDRTCLPVTPRPDLSKRRVPPPRYAPYRLIGLIMTFRNRTATATCICCPSGRIGAAPAGGTGIPGGGVVPDGPNDQVSVLTCGASAAASLLFIQLPGGGPNAF